MVHCFALIRCVTFILFFITCLMSCLFNTSCQFSFGKFFIVSCKGLNFCCQFLSFCQLLSANKKVRRGLCEQKLSEVHYRCNTSNTNFQNETNRVIKMWFLVHHYSYKIHYFYLKIGFGATVTLIK